MINVGVIGFGYWGPNLVRNFSVTPDARVTMVSDRDPKRLAKAQSLYPSVQGTTDDRELIGSSNVDAVVIATPVSLHFDLAMRALAAGKHVLIEKPLTASVEQGERLVAEAERRKRVLMVDHTFVYTGAVRKIRELATNGRVGKLHYYDSVRVNLGLFQHDVNVLWDLAVHDLSIMDYILGSVPSAVSATGIAHIPGQPENMAYLTCFFEERLIAHFHVNWISPVKIRQTLIAGDRQMIVYDDLEPSDKVKVYDKGVTLNDGPEGVYQAMIGYRTGDMWCPNLDVTEALLRMAGHFVECVEGSKTPITDGHCGLRVVRVLEAAAQSMAQHGIPVELERPGVTN